jgi:peptide/nickel transport system permease protein
MIKFIIKRILISIPMLLGIASLVFFVIHIAPGDPLDMLINQYQRNVPSPEIIEAFRIKYGLDQPIHIQYFKWLKNCLSGDLGESFRYHRPVTTLIAERIPFTIQLTFLALLFDALFGILLGIISAVKQYTLTDKIISVGSLIIYSVPGFWLALMLILIFSVNLGWLPLSQTRSLDYDLLSGVDQFKDRLMHLVLPVFVLGIASAASTARYLRSRLLEVLSEEFILAARARGIKEKAVIFSHALKNALIPIITIYGMSLPFLLGGSVLIESIFSWPGMGSLAIEAVQNRDYPLILATTMMGAILVVLGNLLADIMYAIVDPRVSYDT